jgi:glycosyltransferase involved in cell wall biosynthesis
MASRLTKEKNIGSAINAMSDVALRYPRTGLVIVGSGPEKDNLKFKIKNFPPEADQPPLENLLDNIIIESWTDDLVSYYKTCDLFLLTSNYEGYGRTLVEAAAAGCKIISSDVGVADEILEKENIFKPGDPKALKEKIIKAIKGDIKPPKPIRSETKAGYLEKYKKSWLVCL